jgi:hypothetical protein
MLATDPGATGRRSARECGRRCPAHSKHRGPLVHERKAADSQLTGGAGQSLLKQMKSAVANELAI